MQGWPARQRIGQITDEDIAARIRHAVPETKRRDRMCGQRGVDNRPIARAAAQIAGKLVLDRTGVERCRSSFVLGEQAHGNARRAEAALRAVVDDKRLLYRMQRLALREILNGDQLRAVDLAQQQDAGIDRRKGCRAAAAAGQHHGTGAAIALVAALFGAGRASLRAQPVEQGQTGREAGQGNLPSAKAEADLAPRFLPRRCRRHAVISKFIFVIARSRRRRGNPSSG